MLKLDAARRSDCSDDVEKRVGDVVFEAEVEKLETRGPFSVGELCELPIANVQLRMWT